MKITDLDIDEVNQGIAYSVGLIYPLIKVVTYESKEYVAGQINHHGNMITDEELSSHFNQVHSFLSQYISNDLLLLGNLSNRLGNKKGFSLLVEKNDNDFIGILDRIVEIISNSESIDVKKYFIRGCFDGRSSYDTTSGYLSIDVDRDYNKQDKIKNIINNFDIDVNLNQRDLLHPKNDQIRIQRRNLDDFMNKIGFFSVRRIAIIMNRNL